MKAPIPNRISVGCLAKMWRYDVDQIELLKAEGLDIQSETIGTKEIRYVWRHEALRFARESRTPDAADRFNPAERRSFLKVIRAFATAHADNDRRLLDKPYSMAGELAQLAAAHGVECDLSDDTIAKILSEAIGG